MDAFAMGFVAGAFLTAVIVALAWTIYTMEVKPVKVSPGVMFFPWSGRTEVTDLAEHLRAIDFAKGQPQGRETRV